MPLHPCVVLCSCSSCPCAQTTTCRPGCAMLCICHKSAAGIGEELTHSPAAAVLSWLVLCALPACLCVILRLQHTTQQGSHSPSPATTARNTCSVGSCARDASPECSKGKLSSRLQFSVQQGGAVEQVVQCAEQAVSLQARGTIPRARQDATLSADSPHIPLSYTQLQGRAWLVAVSGWWLNKLNIELEGKCRVGNRSPASRLTSPLQPSHARMLFYLPLHGSAADSVRSSQDYGLGSGWQSEDGDRFQAQGKMPRYS